MLIKRLLGFVEEPRVLDRDHRLLGERLQQRQLLIAERPLERAADPQRADGATLEQHWREDDRFRANRAAACARHGRHVACFDIGIDNDPAFEDCYARRSVACERLRKELSELVEAGPAAADIEQAIIADERNANRFAREQPLAALQNRIEHRLRIGDRAADRGEHLARRPLLVERLLRFVEQANVFQRDRRLVAERAQERDFALRERPYLLPAEQDYAERMTLPEERRRDDGAMTPAARDLEARRKLALFRQHVSYVDRLAVEQRAARDRIAADRQSVDVRNRIGGRALRCEMSQRSAIGEIHRRGRRVAKPRSALGDRIEHRQHVRRGARDNAQDLGNGRLLLQRLLRFVEEPYVVDRDRRLPCESLDQRYLVGREKPRLAPEHKDASVGTAFAHQRHRQDGSRAIPLDIRSRVRKLDVEQRANVRVVHGLAVEHGSAVDRGSPQRREQDGLKVRAGLPSVIWPSRGGRPHRREGRARTASCTSAPPVRRPHPAPAVRPSASLK